MIFYAYCICNESISVYKCCKDCDVSLITIKNLYISMEKKMSLISRFDQELLLQWWKISGKEEEEAKNILKVRTNTCSFIFSLY